MTLVNWFKGELRYKNSPLFLYHNFNDFMEKEPCAKPCGVAIISHEVMKLYSSESGVSDTILRVSHSGGMGSAAPLSNDFENTPYQN